MDHLLSCDENNTYQIDTLSKTRCCHLDSYTRTEVFIPQFETFSGTVTMKVGSIEPKKEGVIETYEKIRQTGPIMNNSYYLS